jgi:hypothetical protein
MQDKSLPPTVTNNIMAFYLHPPIVDFCGCNKNPLIEGIE